tara:strand:+ start:210 stop:698 length:489 start_codon:yes stop_codon:yes gene_type:complete
LYSGGWWPWVLFVSLSVLVTIGDRLCPQDHADLQDVNLRAAEAQLSVILPALIALVSPVIGSLVLGAQQVSFPVPLDQVDYVGRWDYSPLQALGVVLSVGLLIGGLGTSAAHECMHRPCGHCLRIVGDWLMALSMDGVFPIEHNYGCHKNVGTVHDAATARH